MTQTLQAIVETWGNDRSLYDPAQLGRRVEVIDELEEALLDVLGQPENASLLLRARTLRDGLEAVNSQIYRQIREDIQQGRGVERLLTWVPDPLFDDMSGRHVGGDRYDYLDALLSGIASWREPGDDIAPLAQDMVFYQPTPARHIFDLIQRLSLDHDDVLIDLGAGLGHVPLLAAICAKAQCIGIEWEAAYVASAQQCASDLKLANASFIQQDARDADLSRGTVFYLYTPFTGAMLRDVLNRLAREAATRIIRVCTLGPCTQVVAGESWLTPVGAWQSADRIAVFRSAQV
ncbi:hypothetical protein GCM10011408_38700 [Dyella caseinilytica]|nr:hypothetical protein GCM10011408_38700 [Dyella caseinilytica]